MNRRYLLQLIGTGAGASLLPGLAKANPGSLPNAPFVYCLNMATIRGHNLGFAKELEVAAKAGFRAVEIWMDSLQIFLNKGSTLTEARQRMKDLGLVAVNAIGFSEWVVDDEGRRRKAIDQLKHEMEQLATVGCTRIAAPPMGAVQDPALSLQKIAERYRTILELGEQTGVTPQLELWGFAKNLSKLSEVLYVAVESGRPSARILLDIYHLYRGGSSLETLPLMHPKAVDILHMNDYLASMLATTITDADRILPGDGVAPIRQVLQTLRSPERPLILSVEVFNKEYYAQDASKVATAALTHLKKVTAGL